MTRIDAHHHIWELTKRPHAWLAGPEMAAIRRDFTITDLALQAKAAAVDRTVLVQVLPSLAETAEFLALAEDSDLVAGVVGWLARPDVRRGLRAVAATGLVYDLLTLPHQLPAAIETVRALPELTFVLDHLSKPPIASGELEPWDTLVRELAAEPNVYCKLSGMVTEGDRRGWTVADFRPYVEVVLGAFGSRVMFGSDWPVCLLAASYADVVSAAAELTAELSPDEQVQVFGGTAARAYNLSEAGA